MCMCVYVFSNLYYLPFYFHTKSLQGFGVVCWCSQVIHFISLYSASLLANFNSPPNPLLFAIY